MVLPLSICKKPPCSNYNLWKSSNSLDFSDTDFKRWLKLLWDIIKKKIKWKKVLTKKTKNKTQTKTRVAITLLCFVNFVKLNIYFHMGYLIIVMKHKNLLILSYCLFHICANGIYIKTNKTYKKNIHQHL